MKYESRRVLFICSIDRSLTQIIDNKHALSTTTKSSERKFNNVFYIKSQSNFGVACPDTASPTVSAALFHPHYQARQSLYRTHAS